MKPTKLPTWKDKRIHWKKFFDSVDAGDTVILPINHRSSFSTQVSHYRRELRCTTEDLGNGYFKGILLDKNESPLPAGAPTWELHVGYVKLYITGPGQDHWFAVSAAHYRGPVGTPAERESARKVVDHLNLHHRADESVTRIQIDALLRRFSPRKPQLLATP